MLISKFDNEDISASIKAFEDEHKIKFPDQYKIFLKKYNGGQTPESKFKLNRVFSDLSGFYGLGEADRRYNYKSLEKNYSFSGWLEDSVLPIATNSFGDYVMIGLTDGKIYFYYHDKEKKYIELSKDFKSFLRACESERIAHIMTIEERKQILIENGKGNKITDEKIAGWQAEIDYYSDLHQEELVLD